MPEIMIPVFDEPVQESFVKAVCEKLLDYYLPDNGHYAKNHLHDFGDKTKLYMNVGETLRILATPTDEKGEPVADFSKEDLAENLILTSVRMLTAIPAIMEMLATMLEDKLSALNWECTKLDFSLYNPDKYAGFKGKDPASRTQVYGMPACLFVLSLKPMSGKVTICAPAKVYQKRHVEPEKQKQRVDHEQTSEVRGQVKKTYASASAPAPAAEATAAAGGGSAFKAPAGGRKPFTGKK
jgi:hypothetical protein